MGDRRPIVALFPPLGCDARIYAPLADALARDARVVGIDYPGFEGDGAPFDFAAPALLERLAAALAARLRSLDAEPAIFGGVSLGGTLSYLVAREVRPRAMLLLAPGGLAVARARKAAILDGIASSPRDAFVRRSLGIDADTFEASGFATHFPSEAPHARRYFEHLAVHTWAAPVFVARADAYVAMLRAAIDVDLEAAIASNTIPTDLVWGAEDRVFTARIHSRYERALAMSKFHLLAGVGHFAPLDAPGALAVILRARLEEL